MIFIVRLEGGGYDEIERDAFDMEGAAVEHVEALHDNGVFDDLGLVIECEVRAPDAAEWTRVEVSVDWSPSFYGYLPRKAVQP